MFLEASSIQLIESNSLTSSFKETSCSSSILKKDSETTLTRMLLSPKNFKIKINLQIGVLTLIKSQETAIMYFPGR